MSHVNFLTAQLKHKAPPILAGKMILVCTPAVQYFCVYSRFSVLNVSVESRLLFQEFELRKYCFWT